jgi:hypothetical protein
MIHFAQEMSHYLSFEVVACAWEQLSVALRNSKTMDQLLTAHEHFLQTVTSRALLDEESRVTLIEFLIIRYNNELGVIILGYKRSFERHS